MDYRSLEREAQRANDFLHAALVYHGKGTQRACDGTGAAKTAWRAKLKASPKTRPDSLLEEIACIAATAEDAARAAREAHEEIMSKIRDELHAKRQAAAKAEVERRRALRDERAEKSLWKGL